MELIFFELQGLNLVESDLELGVDHDKVPVRNEPDEMVFLAVTLVHINAGLFLKFGVVINLKSVDPFGTVGGKLPGDCPELIVGPSKIQTRSYV